MAPRKAPPDPKHWAALRDAELEARKAVPAVRPEPVKPSRNTYKVIGPREVFGVSPGDTGVIELTDGQARALIEAGHIASATTEEA